MSCPVVFTFSRSSTLMSCVAKGLRFFVVVLVRAGNDAFGELKGKEGLVEMLETERETLSTRGTTISWAGVMVKCPKFQALMLN